MISLWDLRSVSVSMELSSSWGCIPPSPIPPSSVVPRHLASGYARGAEISAITFSDDYLVVGGKHFRMCPIEVWDTRGGGKHPGHYKTLSGHGKPIVALAPGLPSSLSLSISLSLCVCVCVCVCVVFGWSRRIRKALTDGVERIEGPHGGALGYLHWSATDRVRSREAALLSAST
jgi:hypothetical protein